MRNALFCLPALLLLLSCGGGGSSGGGSPLPNPTPTLVFTLSPSISVRENGVAVSYSFDVAAFIASQLGYRIAGGADQGLFTISQNGTLSFSAAPDFENPGDANGDNVYQITVEAGDNSTYGRWQFDIIVEDDAETYQVTRMVAGLSSPLFLAGHPDGSDRILIVEKGGQIELYDPAAGSFASPKFLDVSAEVSTGNERGLLGFAPDPDYAVNRMVYIAMTNLAGDTELRRYLTSPANPDTVELPGDVIMVIPQTRSNHLGGWIGFGPDGYLYLALGDGGGAGDPDLNGQDTSTLQGSFLRIDVTGDDFPFDTTRDYAIPADNPFASGGGAPEILAYGFRNPWRSSFDPDTGYLIIGDVGQDAREEIDLLRPEDNGGNYGWNRREGTIAYNGGADDPSFIDPAAEYSHAESNSRSITGGYVYQGTAGELQGKYVFGDFISGRIWALPSDELVQGQTRSFSEFQELTDAFTPDAGTIGNISSFGMDNNGDLYVVDYGGEIFKVEPE